MSDPIGIGIIGAGEISPAHAAAYQALGERVRLAAVADIDEDCARTLAERFRIPAVHRDYHDLLADPHVDAVSICTPSFLHIPHSLDALQAGKHVLCEKPVAANLTDLDRLVLAQRGSGRVFSGVFQHRFGRGARQVKALVDRGRFGRLLLGMTHTLWKRGPDYYANRWRALWAQACGGATVTQGIHGIDTLLWLMGEAAEVSADADTLKMDIEVEDVAAAVIRFRNGALGQILVTVCGQGDRSRLEIYGTDLQALSSEDAYAPTRDPFALAAPDSVFLAAVQREAEAVAPEASPFLHLGAVEDFVAAIEAGREPLVTASACRPSLEMTTALYRSAMMRERVSLPLANTDPFYSCIPAEGTDLPRRVHPAA